MARHQKARNMADFKTSTTEYWSKEPMKAFTLYSKQEANLRVLLNKLQYCGKINCDFETFSQLYYEWHLETFPGCEVDTGAATFRSDWFGSFVDYLANADIEEE